MSKRIYPLSGIRYWYAYDIDGICQLYKKYNLHPQTVRKWLRDGLSATDTGKPTLIYGSDLKKFLGNQNQSGKRKTGFTQIFCMKCQDAKNPFRKQIQLEHVNGFVRAKARCQTCKNIMNKSYKLDDLPQLRSTFDVVGVLELSDSKHTTVNTHIQTQPETHLNEPTQMEMF